MDEKTKYVWKMWGKWYGYPDCCVDAFCKGKQKKGGVFTGTGFVPCAKCYDRDPEDILTQVSVNRLSAQPFTVTDFSKEGTLDFIKSFWECMEESYDRNSN